MFIAGFFSVEGEILDLHKAQTTCEQQIVLRRADVMKSNPMYSRRLEGHIFGIDEKGMIKCLNHHPNMLKLKLSIPAQQSLYIQKSFPSFSNMELFEV